MTQRIDLRLVATLVVLLVLAGRSQPVRTAERVKAAGVPAADVIITEASFRCIRDMTPVRGLYVANLLGNLEATLAVARSPAGGTWPPGSLVQVVPNSAMVKHRPGRNPETNDWEFIELDVKASGATIVGRGFAELNMRAGANCFNCHMPAKSAWDLICEQGHDCLPVPFTQSMLRGIQNTDPRCPKIELPQDQIEALAALATRGAPPPAAQK